ncbi:MAG: 4Fe-4S binding protein [Anaerolineales bacterium]|nr:4Fe-4S binding protein [Anaerolineales bacterium]MCX7608437.1 4Fe-4S binding protein [Anaerolineales bacterium]MDW8227842.1 4Fe-4S binding protein [Anaerolineales bacterium]
MPEPTAVSSQETPLPAPQLGVKKPRGRVTIYAKWCKGCRICVEFCPTGVLALPPGEEVAQVVAPEKCTACHFCDTHCPDLAIVVERIA